MVWLFSAVQVGFEEIHALRFPKDPLELTHVTVHGLLVGLFKLGRLRVHRDREQLLVRVGQLAGPPSAAHIIDIELARHHDCPEVLVEAGRCLCSSRVVHVRVPGRNLQVVGHAAHVGRRCALPIRKLKFVVQFLQGRAVHMQRLSWLRIAG